MMTIAEAEKRLLRALNEPSPAFAHEIEVLASVLFAHLGIEAGRPDGFLPVCDPVQGQAVSAVGLLVFVEDQRVEQARVDLVVDQDRSEIRAGSFLIGNRLVAGITKYGTAGQNRLGDQIAAKGVRFDCEWRIRTEKAAGTWKVAAT